MMPPKYTNPILPGFQPDPSICKVGTDYYLVTSSFEIFPGLPIHHSRDLVNWRLIGHALHRPGQINLETLVNSKGIYAPTLRYAKGRFYLICTDVNGIGNFILHAKNAAGPWSDPVLVAVEGIDPSLYFHDDNRIFFTCSAPGQAGIWGAEIDPDSGILLTEPKIWWRGTGGKFPEGPHIYFREGWYYLLISEGGTEVGHMVTVARSRQPDGPYEPGTSQPILSHRSLEHPLQSTGHADLTQDRNGDWWMVFHAARHVTFGYPAMHHLGRETCLVPVSWTADGWPTVQVPMAPDYPCPPRETTEAKEALEPWVFRRTPPESLRDCAPKNGECILPCLPANLNEARPMAFVARRQTAFAITFSATVELTSQSLRDEAGIAVVMNDLHHARIVCSRDAEGLSVFVAQQIGAVSVELARRPIQENKVELRIRAEAKEYVFELNGTSGWETLTRVSTRHLSTELAGGFTGVLLEIYATSNGGVSEGTARFQNITYLLE